MDSITRTATVSQPFLFAETTTSSCRLFGKMTQMIENAHDANVISSFHSPCEPENSYYIHFICLEIIAYDMLL